jgi:hypothetical protein
MPNAARIRSTVLHVQDVSSGPVSGQALVSDGLTRGQLRAALAAGELIVLRRGIFIPRGQWDDGTIEQRRLWAARAALLAFPTAFASHGTAAWLHGLPEYRLDRIDRESVPATHITRIGAARHDDWLRVHGCDTTLDQVATLRGIATTDLIRTSIELAANRSLATAVVFLDAAMRLAVAEQFVDAEIRRAVLRADVCQSLRRRWRLGLIPYARHRWVTRVRLAVDLADPASESVLESLSRVAIHGAPWPMPRCGVPVVGDDGIVYWVDMLWEDCRLIGEVDGAVKYSDPVRLLAEKRRQEALEGRGYRFVRWGWAEVVPDPTVMLRRVGRALST